MKKEQPKPYNFYADLEHQIEQINDYSDQNHVREVRHQISILNRNYEPNKRILELAGQKGLV